MRTESLEKNSTTGVRLRGEITGAVRACPEFEALVESSDLGVSRGTCPEELLPTLLSSLWIERSRPCLVLVPGYRWAEELEEDLRFFLGNRTESLPPVDTEEGDPFTTFTEGAGQRHRSAAVLRGGGVVVAVPESLAQGIPPGQGENWPLVLERGSTLYMERIPELLVEGGYTRGYQVAERGDFSIRGGILDIFPSTGEHPIRIEMSGDEVFSLREFSVVTQRSTGDIDSVGIYPALEATGTELSLPEARLVVVERELVEARWEKYFRDRGEEERPLTDPWDSVVIVGSSSAATAEADWTFECEPLPGMPGRPYQTVHHWRRLEEGGIRVRLVLDNSAQISRIREIWAEEGIDGAFPRAAEGRLNRGFYSPRLAVALYTSADLFGRRETRRRERRSTSGTPVAHHEQIKKGEYVVHLEQGIGVYGGLVTLEREGFTREYLLLEYAQGDRLYVPANQLAKVQRYVGGAEPRVNRLRSKEWSRTKRKAKLSAARAARELLELYLERKTTEGFAFSPDTAWQRELEDSFDYEMTSDQDRAAVEVKRDMESVAPMDRLVCGDVGYGKTEVAVRAAMKAIMDSKQVALLVPTTVLAEQHLETFRSRMAAFPIEIRALSRFRASGEQKEILERIADGGVDLVVGTHRLLQDDVGFRDLGLLIIDEEHRFGVADKEKLRRMRREVDTLVMTATPIPRTLQMSLSGVRDMSIIDTPPEDRFPIATYVGEYESKVVKTAIARELNREGQVFYVFNRVEGIETVAAELRRLFPGRRVAVAHGQMRETELESAMLEFAGGECDVLVCTTIIESGLDLPNVNTLIVDGAERMGLAQLYQLRGRVGRAHQRAFAYLLFRDRSLLTDTSVARLSTISEMTALGSGARVAMKDLEIRGAGNLLGHEQHGYIEAVGFELYCMLLEEAVAALSGEEKGTPDKALVEIPLNTYLPEEYVSEEESRIDIYRRVMMAVRGSDLDDLSEELEDRFGDLPPPVELLIGSERLRIRAGGAGIRSMRMVNDELGITGGPDTVPVLESLSAKCSLLREANGYFDAESKTLYIKTGRAQSEAGQVGLLAWLNEIVDDIIEAEQSILTEASEED